MKKIFLFFILINLTNLLRAQYFKKYFNDTLIKFEIVTPTSIFKNGTFYPNPKKYITTNLPDSILKQLVKLTPAKWDELLQDPNTSYSTNLYLYQILLKDATSYIVFKDKQSWEKYLKKQDVTYWRSYIKRNKVKIKSAS